LAVLTPRGAEPPAGIAFLRTALDRGGTFFHAVADLTGLEHRGEHLAAFDILDAVVLVARAGRTRTRQVQRWLREIPDPRGLGVLLTGL
jgi:hypothetical protein